MSSNIQGLESGTSDTSRSQANKTQQTRRSWSTKEELVLLFALKELVAQGWKSDNGFRAGFLGKLEDALKKEFPGTDLKATPHIKIGSWKKFYNSLVSMLDKSGIGNLNGDYMIDCSNDQWEHIVNCDPGARGMRKKSWPLFEDWKEIFGKHRANGKTAQDLMDAINDMTSRDNLARDVISKENGQNVQVEDEIDIDVAENSVCQSENVSERPRSSRKKRKQDESIERLLDALVQLGRNTDKRLEHIGTRTGYEFDLSKARTEVYETLSAIPGLSKRDKFEVCETLTEKVERLELFMGLPKEARMDYLLYVLDTRGH
ncbi:uncharacterized protein LOC130995674 [Salvia miltiorrhiza]|uniref:uncharacterized protein LOC130995674 n=1 Tax=Salvia miltiorrhiza TaxID=226208 RepID=UPI0025ACF54C|nr:uncharacterized protein LOC130995674 [Salvia miltiorrhiza]